MTTHPDEFGGVEERLLDAAIEATDGQFVEAERIVTQRFPMVSGDSKARLIVAVVQAISTNYLAAATVRNQPKS